ncbi:MAG: cell division protein FtsL [Hyphomicrobiales bacterium]
MHRILNGILILCLLGAAFVMYTLEHDTRRGERQIAKLKNEIQDEREQIRLLTAEWSNLSRPQRLEQLAAEHLKLQPLTPLQYVLRKDIATRLPDQPIEIVGPKPDDPIADMLKVLQ